jgi:hypothetical protein
MPSPHQVSAGFRNNIPLAQSGTVAEGQFRFAAISDIEGEGKKAGKLKWNQGS